MSELHENPAPAVPLAAAAALVIVTLIGVAFQKLYINPNSEQVAPVRVLVAERQLQFVDRDNGAVEVRVMPQNEVLDVIEAGDGGFLRGILRGLVRERRLEAASMSPGFLLQQFEGGAVVLTDMSTTREIDLRAFGSINAKDFLRYLPNAPATVPVAGDGTVTQN